MMSKIRGFEGSLVFTIVSLGLAFLVGWEFDRTLAGGLTALFSAAILGVLEVSLSFDNAVVNAKVLGGMDAYWRRMFLTLGMVIAVFGMRIVLPLVIVWAVSDHGFAEVVTMTWRDPSKFQGILVDQHIRVAGFGGAFLWMVFAQFFFDETKETHWLRHIETMLARTGRMSSVWVTITMAITFSFWKFVEPAHQSEFLLAAMLGILANLVVEGTGSLVRTGGGAPAAKVATAGLASFLYLEVLDASFSFDGVIGAFAITGNIFVIALGLGIGAMFVRSMTIKLVDSNTLAHYEYLEHGAFWAIGALALIMFLAAAGVHVHEVVSGLVGVVLIGLSIYSSVRSNHRRAKQARAAP